MRKLNYGNYYTFVLFTIKLIPFVLRIICSNLQLKGRRPQNDMLFFLPVSGLSQN